MKNKSRISILLLSLCAVFFLFTTKVYAASPTDEITDYTITVDINEDATVNIQYHLDWLVLESDGIGPVSWVEVGIPNSQCISYEGLTDNIKSISRSGSMMRIDFDKSYYEGEVISFDFKIVQNNLYQVNKFNEGYTVYTFTPGWFDEIAVDNITIRWNNDKAESWTPDCKIEGDYNVFTRSLEPGEMFTISMTYPNDAFAFDLTMDTEYKESTGEKIANGIGMFVGVIIFLVLMAAIFIGPFIFIGAIIYGIGKGFGGSGYTKKITRTKIEYYPSCEGCGAPRKEGEKFCSFCGRSMIKSEEVVEEKDVPDEIKKKTSKGEYRYSSSPNTYYRVNVVRVPVPRSTSSVSHRSSCAHSSCAHSSCACACACACAGGGRAGCTNKDFYNTKLKMKHIRKAVGDK